MWREPLDRLGSGLVFAGSGDDLDGLTAELSEAGWFVARCDCSTANDKATLIHAIATSLEFPEWTGRNWDACADSLTDLGWLDASSVVLVLDHVDQIRAAAPAHWQTAREIMTEAAEWWQSEQKTLIVIVA